PGSPSKGGNGSSGPDTFVFFRLTSAASMPPASQTKRSTSARPARAGIGSREKSDIALGGDGEIREGADALSPGHLRYFRGENSVGLRNTLSTFSTSAPFFSDSLRVAVHSGSALKAFQLCCAAASVGNARR